MKYRILFVGGVADGETRELEDNIDLHPVFRKEGFSIYERASITGENYKFYIMLEQGINIRQAIGMLIDGYENHFSRIY